MLDYLIHLVGRLGNWGYLVIFVGATLESAAFLGLFVPGESLVLIAGFLSAQGLLDLDVLVLTVALGAILGDNIGYELGRGLGRPWILRYGRRIGIDEARLRRTDEFFARHGGKSVLLGRFVGFARALVPFIAGSTRMRYRVFLVYNALGAALWATAFVLLGYFLGASWQVAQRWIGRASAIVGGAILFAMVLTWLWRWLMRHEAAIQQRWARWQGHPRIAPLRRRFAPQTTWLRARLSPTGYMGLQLTLGILVLVAASWLFGGIAKNVGAGEPLTLVDKQVAAWFHAHATPALTTVMQFISSAHEWSVTLALAVLLLGYFWWKRQWEWMLALALAVPGGMLLNVVLKLAFHRPRPTFEDSINALQTYSFPSGHALAATVFYGVVTALVVSVVDAWRWRVLAVFVAVILVILVGLSRVYLGVHYLSDVLAGAAEGIAWLALSFMAVNTLRREAQT